MNAGYHIGVVCRLLTIVLALIITACGTSSENTTKTTDVVNEPGGNQPPATLQQKLDAYVYDSAAANGPGLAVLVMRNNNEVYRIVRGMANTQIDQAITYDTGFRIASVSKLFTALAIMQLYEKNALSLDTSITALLPELPSHWAEITVHHLLAHRSGIPDYINDISTARFSEEASSDEVMAFLVEGPALRFAPGSSARYSNSGYFLLAQIVVRVSGLSFADYMDSHIFSVANMTSSYIFDDREKFRSGDALSGANTHLLLGKLWLAPGASSQVSSLNDFVQFYQALIASRIVSLETWSLMNQAHSSGIFGRSYGYGLMLTDVTTKVTGHEGLLGGFVPALRMSESRGWYVVVLNNGAGQDRAAKILDIVTNHFN